MVARNGQTDREIDRETERKRGTQDAKRGQKKRKSVRNGELVIGWWEFGHSTIVYIKSEKEVECSFWL